MVGNEHGVITTLDHDAQVAQPVPAPRRREVHRRRRRLDLRRLRRRQRLRPVRQGAPAWRTRSPRTSTSTGWTSTTASSASPTRTAASPPSTTRTSSCGVGPGGARSAWMVRCDDDAVYHGHSHGRDRLRLAYRRANCGTPPPARCSSAGRSTARVFAGHRHPRGGAAVQGRVGSNAPTAATPRSSPAPPPRAASTSSPATASSSIYCFDAAGTRLWKLGTGCGSAYSMQYHDDRLYIVTTDGHSGLHRRQRGGDPRGAGRAPCPRCATSRPRARRPQPVQPTIVEVTSDAGAGVVVECLDDRGRLRVQVALRRLPARLVGAVPQGHPRAGRPLPGDRGARVQPRWLLPRVRRHPPPALSGERAASAIEGSRSRTPVS